MIHRVCRGVFLASVVFALVAGVSGTAAACEAVPSRLARVAKSAQYIVVGRITARSTTTDTSLTVDVSRTLKGSVSGRLQINQIRSSVCGDGAPGSDGETLIFARHFTTIFRETLDAYWTFDTAGSLLETNVLRFKSDPPATVDSVVASILGQLPATDASIAEPASPQFDLLFVLLAMGLAGAAANGLHRRVSAGD